MTVLETRNLSCDVLVAGGGPAGVPAAIAAARLGARVILCQDRSMLGGNASSEVRMHVMGADSSGNRGKELETEAREGGIVEELRLESCVRNPQRSAAMLDLIHYERCRAEPNLTLMLDTSVTGVEMSEGRISAAIADRPLTEERFVIRAHTFIDCTGDGRLGAEAGAPFRRGREATSEFGESLAQPAADAASLGSTILFTARQHDRPMPFTPPSWIRRVDRDFFKLRSLEGGIEYGYWWCEWGGRLDTIRDQPRVRDELLGIVLGVWDYLKNGGTDAERARSANWALDWFGFLPGKRESRRFLGQHVLCEGDLLQSRSHPDAIAYGGWTIDIHPPDGVDRPDLPPTVHTRLPYLYDIPLRCCVSRTVPNLMFAGRNHSATHVAFASTRVMATCSAMGQGVGTAAAYAAAHGLDAAGLAADADAMTAIRQRLLRDDCYLIGARNADPRDRIPSARISASGARADGPAEQVASGQTRAVHGPGGVAPERTRSGSNRWISAPLASGPAWIAFAWERPVRPVEIQLIFDTGLHRMLALSHSDGITRRMHYGSPQPETVRDYHIEGLVDGRWTDLHRIAGNHQRRRVHRLEGPPAIVALRVTVTATNGCEAARICEARLYEGDAQWVEH